MITLKKIRNIYNSYIKNFLRDIFHLINLHIFVFIIFFTLKAVFTVIGNKHLYLKALNMFIISGFWKSVIYKPWVLFTYFLINENIIHLFFDMLILYNFGNILTKLMDVRRTIVAYVAGAVFSGLFFLLITNIRATHMSLSSSIYGIYAVIFSCVSFAPDYPINLLFINNIKLKFFAMFFILLSVSKLTDDRIEQGLTELFAALLGYLNIKLLNRGIEINKPFFYVYDWINRCLSEKKKSSDIYISYKRKK